MLLGGQKRVINSGLGRWQAAARAMQIDGRGPSPMDEKCIHNKYLVNGINQVP